MQSPYRNLRLRTGSSTAAPGPGTRKPQAAPVPQAHWKDPGQPILNLPCLLLLPETAAKAPAHIVPLSPCLMTDLAVSLWASSSWELWVSNCHFSGTCLVIYWPHHTWIIIKAVLKNTQPRISVDSILLRHIQDSTTSHCGSLGGPPPPAITWNPKTHPSLLSTATPVVLLHRQAGPTAFLFRALQLKG